MVEVKRHRQSKEHIEQVKFVGYIKLFHPKYLIWSIPNGSAVSAAQRIKLAKEGMLAGMPDLMVLSPTGRLMGIEMKRPKGVGVGKGVASKAQEWVKERLIGVGISCPTCFSFEEAREAFDAFALGE